MASGRRWRNWIPWLLIFGRAMLGPLMFWGAIRHLGWAWLAAGLGLAFFSDIFDGVLARRWQTVTERLRVADSWTDFLYYFCVAAAVVQAHPGVIAAYRLSLTGIITLQLVSWMIDLIRYRRIASFHTYLSKATGVLLFLASVAILCFDRPAPFLGLAILVSFIGNIEGIAMVCLLPKWTHDVPTVWHALRRAAAAAHEFAER